ncbi:MAG: tetratricopeptide repeat protein [Melioribacteraceae bacterium]|nr:tetratricopeptide repeat protein [Melioribacteraceae bacterium]
MIKQLLRNNSILIILLLFSFSKMDAQDLYTAGVMEFQNNNYEAAIESFEKYILFQPNDLSAYQYLINSYIALEKYDKAITILEENRFKFPDNKDMPLLLGKLYLNKQDFDKSEKIFSELNRKHPGEAEIKLLLSRIYYNKGIKRADAEMFDEAEYLLRKSLSLESDLPEAYALLGNILMQTDKIDEADKVFRQGLMKFPDNDVLLGNYSLLMIKKKNYDKAIIDLEKVWNNNKDNIQIGLQLAMLYRAKYKIPEAFEIYEFLLKKYPKEKSIYEEMLKYYTIIDDQEKRREIFERMEKAFPKDEKIAINKIETFAKEGKDSLAIFHYNSYLETHNKEFDVYFKLANLYEKEKKYNEGIDVLIKGKKEGLTTEEFYLKLGYLYEKKNQIDKALQTFNEMIELYPQNFLPYYRSGNIFFDKNNLDSAKVYYELALKAEEKQPFVLAKLANLYEKENNKGKAIAYYKNSFINNMISLNSEQQLMMTQLQSTNNLLGMMDEIDLSSEDRIKKYKSNIDNANKYLMNNLSNAKYLDEINNLIDDYPTSSILYYYKGIFYESKNNFTEAEELYKRVLSVAVKDIETHKRLAVLYQKMGAMNKAILSYKRVLSLNDTDSETYKALIKLYREEENLSELCDEWMKLYFTQPDNEILKEYLIEALHKADRNEDVSKIINKSK